MNLRVSPDKLQPLIRDEARKMYEVHLAKTHPANLLDHVKCIDNATGETFDFQLLNKRAGWYWQRELLDDWIKENAYINLKARQIGITWLAAGYALWMLLYKPASKVLVVSINETEAIKVVNRIWDMLESLPEHLRPVEVIKPKRERPSKQIQLKHRNGLISTVIGLPSTKSAGHGETAALVILDEFARQEYARDTWKAVLPTTQNGGKIVIISTGNGISTETGGNFFHSLWVNSDEYGIGKRFLPWDLHPDRDEDWYVREAGKLSLADRGEQYPRNEREAFILTGSPYFDVEALTWYDEQIPEPLYRFDFEEVGMSARMKIGPAGLIRVYEKPHPDKSYAIGADVSTGRGYDFSAAYVIDLTEMKFVAELHGKLDPDQFAMQLHYLGNWYGKALLAVEMGGGFGEAVVIPLRDGRAGRPRYAHLYKHVFDNRPDRPMAKPFGFPINQHTRADIMSQIEQAVRDRLLPFLTRRLLDECMTFVRAESGPSPRAQDGTNDDAVFAAAISLEMYRQRGHHPKLIARREKQKRPQQKYETLYPWDKPDMAKRMKKLNERYAPEGSPS